MENVNCNVSLHDYREKIDYSGHIKNTQQDIFSPC